MTEKQHDRTLIIEDPAFQRLCEMLEKQDPARVCQLMSELEAVADREEDFSDEQ